MLTFGEDRVLMIVDDGREIAEEGAHGVVEGDEVCLEEKA